MKFTAFFLIAWLLAYHQVAYGVTVDWTTIVNDRGDRLPDFSFCGYHASNDALPSITSEPSVAVAASDGDQTLRIQAALDKASAAGGGVVKLGPGTFQVSSGLNVTSNVTLRGSGIASTTLSVSKLTAGLPLVSLGNGTNHYAAAFLSSSITNDYVGIGARTVTVANSDGFQVGQAIFVSRAVTAEWVRENGMADLVRDGDHQTWINVGTPVLQPSTIAAISGNNITLTIPLTDALDKQYMSPYMVAYHPPPSPREMGLESLSIILSPSCSGVVLNDTTCITDAVSIAPWTVDAFIRQVNITGFNSFISVQANASRITIEDVGLFRDNNTDNSRGYPADISIAGSQTLIRDSGQYGLSTAKSFAVVTGSGVPGPNAVLRHVTRSSSQIYPHQRWAHGFLAEDTDAGISFVNRGISGSGQGWSISAGVAWNVRGPAGIQSPPLGINWGVGITGTLQSGSNGTMIDNGTAVMPTSLFAAQLADRT